MEREFLVVGEGSFAQQCAEMASCGCTPAAAASPDGSLEAFATSVGVPHFRTREALAEFLTEHSVDYLFSLNNPLVLTPEMLACVSGLAVNYHDSMLPAYAGLHATTWAVAAGESEHGVTFHEVVPDIDAGRILLQRAISVEAQETAVSLNAKCFEAGLELFDELLDRLRDGQVATRPQVGKRSYFGARHRPLGGGFLDPRQSAATLERLIRSLEFGPTPNPVALAKLATTDGVFVVREAHVEAGGSTPGEVSRLTRDGSGLWFPARGGGLRLTRLETLEGQPVSLDACPLELVAQPTLDGWIERDATLGRYDRFWWKRWWMPRFEHPLLTSQRAPTPAVVQRPASAETCQAWAALGEHEHFTRDTTDRAGIARAAAVSFCIYAVRVGSGGGVTPRVVGHRGPGQVDLPDHRVSAVPMRLPALESTLGQITDHVRAEFDRCRSRGAPMRDLARRWRGGPGALDSFGVRIDQSTGGEPAPLVLDLSGPKPMWRSDGTFDDASLLQIDANVGHLAGELAAGALPASAAMSETASVLRGPRVVGVRTTVATRFEQAARQRGSDPALLVADGCTTYASLLEQSQAVAAGLAAKGVGPGSRVGIMCRSPAPFVVALLGSMRCGAAYIPIDPELPDARTEAILEVARPARVIVDEPRTAPAADTVLEDLASLLELGRRNTVPKGPDLDDAAYVIFTSGSTGRPKGVEVTHRNLAAQLDARLYGYGDCAPHIGTFHSLAFDSAVAALFWSLTTGGALYVADADTRRDPEAMRTAIARHRCTHVDVPPSAWGELLAAGVHQLDSLEAVIVGGEACSPHLARAQLEALPEVALYNEYGPTEATVYATVHLVDQASVDRGGSVPIGQPIANLEARVVDGLGQPLPQGYPGELWIGGPQVAKGYVGQVALTDERFPRTSEGRFYRTGDLARVDADGQLRLSGRIDRQVQVRGHRVELGEVRNALVALPEIQAAAVQARPRGGTTQLVAHVVMASAATFDARRIRADLRRSLPTYMIPSAIGRVSHIPRTAAGKADLGALPPLRAPSRPGAPPRTPLEASVLGLMREELDNPTFGVDDDFFESGGHSLMAMRLARRLADDHPAAGIRVVSVYQCPTAARLAVRLSAPHAVDTEHAHFVVPIQPGEPERVPVYAVHVLGEGAAFFRPLARRLGSTRPVIGLASPVRPDASHQLTGIEELARRYCRELLARQPSGPYCLTAVSLGGVVAWEMAQQLRRMGRSVELLALFDTFGPRPPPQALRHRVATHLRGIQAAPVEYIGSRIRQRLGHLAELIRDTRVRVSERLGRSLSPEMKLQLAMRRNLEASLEYRIEPLDGPVVIYRATEECYYDESYAGDGLGWAGYASEVEVVDVPDTHIGIVSEPAVGVLAEDLAIRLAALDALGMRRAPA